MIDLSLYLAFIAAVTVLMAIPGPNVAAIDGDAGLARLDDQPEDPAVLRRLLPAVRGGGPGRGAAGCLALGDLRRAGHSGGWKLGAGGRPRPPSPGQPRPLAKPDLGR